MYDSRTESRRFMAVLGVYSVAATYITSSSLVKKSSRILTVSFENEEIDKVKGMTSDQPKLRSFSCSSGVRAANS